MRRELTNPVLLTNPNQPFSITSLIRTSNRYLSQFHSQWIFSQKRIHNSVMYSGRVPSSKSKTQTMRQLALEKLTMESLINLSQEMSLQEMTSKNCVSWQKLHKFNSNVLGLIKIVKSSETLWLASRADSSTLFPEVHYPLRMRTPTMRSPSYPT